MRRAVMDSIFNLIISVIVITFILSIGYYEIEHYLRNRELQLFQNDVSEIVNNVNYLIQTNSRGSFSQTSLKLPVNQTLHFNNESNNLTLTGVIKKNITLGAELINELELNKSGTYTITICYDCGEDKEYLVRIR